MTCGRGDAGPTCQGPPRRPPEHRRAGAVLRLRPFAHGEVAAGRCTVLSRWPAELLPGQKAKRPSLPQVFASSDQNIRVTEKPPPPRESRVAAMKVELAARTSQTGKTEDTPPPSPAAVDAPSAAEDAPLLPDGGVRRRAGCGRFARSGSFRREVSRAAAETFLLTRLTLILLRYLGYMSITFRFSFWLLVAILVCCAACFTYAMY